VVTRESVAQRLGLTAGLQGNRGPSTLSWTDRHCGVEEELGDARRSANRNDVGVDTADAVPTDLLLRTAVRVREGREKTLYGSKGRFFPHLAGKSLILRKSRTNSSESGHFKELGTKK
jgi:hypothetical protein